MKYRRTGFTLVELLVVIAIIGVLVGLLLPAVQAAREAARRMQCGNNLKQISLGMHNYHDTFNVLPPNFINQGPQVHWGWGLMMLPFIEQRPLYDQINPSLWGAGGGDPVHVPSPTNGLQATVATYLCPSNVGLDGNNLNSSRFAVNFSAILDGLSNTMLLAERDTHRRGGGAWAGRARSTAATGFRVVWPINSVGTDRWNNPTCFRYAIGSLHPGGMQFAFADGSVHFLSETIEAATAPANHGCGNSGQTIDAFFPMNNFVYQKLYNIRDGMPVQIP